MSIQKVDDRPAFLSLSNPFWEFENDTNLSQAGLHDVCLRGYEGALQSSQSKDEFRRIMGPELTLNFEDGEQIIWQLAVNGTEPKLQISDAGWQNAYRTSTRAAQRKRRHSQHAGSTTHGRGGHVCACADTEEEH